jgi:hypothetical protein
VLVIAARRPFWVIEVMKVTAEEEFLLNLEAGVNLLAKLIVSSGT